MFINVYARISWFVKEEIEKYFTSRSIEVFYDVSSRVTTVVRIQLRYDTRSGL